MSEFFLIDVVYSRESRKAELWFLNENNQFLKVIDPTGHQPYLLSSQNIQTEFVKEEVTKYDAIHWQEKSFLKYLVEKPTDVFDKNTKKGLRILLKDGSWEDNIHYRYCYLFDQSWTMMMPFPDVENGKLSMYGQDLMTHSATMESFTEQWVMFANIPVPQLPFVAVDIEVPPENGKLPDVKKATSPIIAIAFVCHDYEKVLLLEDFSSEKEMLEVALAILRTFRLVHTFNGDTFDFPYLRARCVHFGINVRDFYIAYREEEIFTTRLNFALHLDLFKFFNNSSFRTYAFGGKYEPYPSLSMLSKLFLKREKKGEGIRVGKMSRQELHEYVLEDARLTYELGVFAFPLMTFLARLCRFSLFDVCRESISSFVINLLQAEHRKLGYLIPRQEDLKEKFSGVDVLKEHGGIKGAYIVEPVEGVHFNVFLLDVHSLYPSIVDYHNLSYETVCCPHEECRENIVPELGFHVCKKQRGINSLVIGSLKDVRIALKKKAEEEKDLQQKSNLEAIVGALKVLLVSSYGILADSDLPIYAAPVAASITAYGRFTLQGVVKLAEKNGFKVLYGDTDSAFLLPSTSQTVEKLMNIIQEELGVEIGFEKTLRYLVLHRKKNYLGVDMKGVVMLKGLLVKKRHTPPFIKTMFSEISSILSKVTSPQEFIQARVEIEKITSRVYKALESKTITLSDLCFTMRLSKPITEGTGQVYDVARYAAERGIVFGPGDDVSFVLTNGTYSAKPAGFVEQEEIDVQKYVEHLQSSIGDQILSHLGISLTSAVMGEGLFRFAKKTS